MTSWTGRARCAATRHRVEQYRFGRPVSDKVKRAPQNKQHGSLLDTVTNEPMLEQVQAQVEAVDVRAADLANPRPDCRPPLAESVVPDRRVGLIALAHVTKLPDAGFRYKRQVSSAVATARPT